MRNAGRIQRRNRYYKQMHAYRDTSLFHSLSHQDSFRVLKSKSTQWILFCNFMIASFSWKYIGWQMICQNAYDSWVSHNNVTRILKNPMLSETTESAACIAQSILLNHSYSKEKKKVHCHKMLFDPETSGMRTSIKLPFSSETRYWIF